jgi:hypothetical protein
MNLARRWPVAKLSGSDLCVGVMAVALSLGGYVELDAIWDNLLPDPAPLGTICCPHPRGVGERWAAARALAGFPTFVRFAWYSAAVVMAARRAACRRRLKRPARRATSAHDIWASWILVSPHATPRAATARRLTLSRPSPAPARPTYYGQDRLADRNGTWMCPSTRPRRPSPRHFSLVELPRTVGSSDRSGVLGGAVVRVGLANKGPVPSGFTHGFALVLWSRPEALLGPTVRASTSGFARVDRRSEAEAIDATRPRCRNRHLGPRYGHQRTR